MQAYWIRIALGAVAIFALGMVGISLVRHGVSNVREVAEGAGPVTLPVMFVPFKLDGQKLGTIKKVVLHRDAPKRLAGIELGIRLTDSVLARGLAGCRLVANLSDDKNPRPDEVDVGPLIDGVFSCLRGGDTTSRFQEFGHAVFQPGDVSVPLLLPNDMVSDLKEGHLPSEAQDSAEAQAEAQADSIAAETEARADSIAAAAEERADSIVRRSERLVDSLREEGLRRADSARRSADRMADPAPSR